MRVEAQISKQAGIINKHTLISVFRPAFLAFITSGLRLASPYFCVSLQYWIPYTPKHRISPTNMRKVWKKG